MHGTLGFVVNNLTPMAEPEDKSHYCKPQVPD